MKCIFCKIELTKKTRVKHLPSYDDWCEPCQKAEDVRYRRDDNIREALYARLPRYMIPHNLWPESGYEPAPK